MRKLPPHIVWPGFVIALLGMSITTGTITVLAATRDPASFAVVDDYYEKGLRWDEHKAQLTKNSELGWEVSVEVGEPDALRRRPLVVMVLDREGIPIEGATIEASIYHHAAAKRVETLTLEPGSIPGQYQAQADIARHGLWQITLAVSARGEYFTNDRMLNLQW
ncbi:hypothetical protein MNBD_PLANCTO03-913 [hydrothermal vent metagenome]|uniref:Type cbb3 cytochrome oxidase biogenesis protein CcoH n=1 Tax=hydrothermal vent metagenome TaxID=652676 RepID=A0A3B1DU64_9ZZZZ